MHRFRKALTPQRKQSEKKAEPKALIVMTGGYNELVRALGLAEMLKPASTDIDQIIKDVSRSSLFYQQHGEYRKFCVQVIATNPSEYMQGDFMGTAIPPLIPAQCMNMKVKDQYLAAYGFKLGEDEVLVPDSHSFSYFNDQGTLSGFSYSAIKIHGSETGTRTGNGHWAIAVIHNPTAPISERQVTMVMDLKPELFKLLFKLPETIKPEKLPVEKLSTHMRTLLKSDEFHDFLGFSDKHGLLHADGRPKPLAPEVVKSGSSEVRGGVIHPSSTIQETLIQDDVDQERMNVAEMQTLLFMLDDSEESSKFISFLMNRNFPDEKIFAGADAQYILGLSSDHKEKSSKLKQLRQRYITTIPTEIKAALPSIRFVNNKFFLLNVAETGLTFLVEGNRRILKYGDAIFAEAIVDADNQWKLRFYPKVYKKSAYKIPTEEEISEYVDMAYLNYLELKDKSEAELRLMLRKLLASFGYADLHLNKLVFEVEKKLREKIIAEVAAAMIDSGSVNAESYSDDIFGLVSPSTSDSGSSASTTSSGEEISHEEDPSTPPPSTSSFTQISFFNARPTRIVAGTAGATSTVAGGTSLALLKFLPTALLFLHLGPLAIMILSIVLMCAGAAGMTFGLTQAYRARG